MTDPLASQPPPVMSPPPDRSAPEPARPKWPTVIGVIAIVFGSLGSFGGCMGMLSPLFMGMMANQAAQMGEAARVQMEVSQRFSGYTALASIPMFALALLLLAAGIGLLRRRAWGRTAILWWSVFRMVVAVPVALVNYVMMLTMIEEMVAADLEAALPGLMGLFAQFGAFSIAVSLMWAWAFPVFCIVWMLRAPVKSEVERWTLESRAAI